MGGSAVSLRSFLRVGSSLSVYGTARLGSALSLLDHANLGSSLSVRRVTREIWRAGVAAATMPCPLGRVPKRRR